MAMAATLPVLGLSSALKPLRTSRVAKASHPTPLPLICRIQASQASQASGSHRVSASRTLRAANSCELDFARVSSAKSDEHCSSSGRSAEEPWLSTGRAAAFAVAGSLLSAGASLADEGLVEAIDGSDVGISTTVSVLFVVATIGLVVLTGSVVYLGLSDVLEKRALQEEQKKVAESSPKSKKSVKQTVKAAARAGGPKGFGSSKRGKGDGEDTAGSD